MDDNWRPGGMVLWIWTWLGIRARLGLHLFPCVDWWPSVDVDSSQVTDLLSWAHTCLWEREGSFLFCRGFRLFSDRLIGGGDGEGLSTTLSSGLRSGGLESKFRRWPGPLDRRVVGWSCLCLGYKRDVCFRVSSWDTLVRESPRDAVRLGYGLAP